MRVKPLTYPALRDFFGSKWSWIACTGLVILFAACLTWMVWQMQDPDKTMPDFRARFESARITEARWDKEVLSIQLGIAPNYDSVTEAARDMKIRMAKLAQQTQDHASLAGLSATVDEYKRAIEHKAWLSEQVKASYAMLRNAVSVLPNAISDSYEAQEVLQILPNANKRTADLITEAITSMVSFTISPTPLLHSAMQERNASLRAATRTMPPDLRRTIERFLVQIEVVIAERRRGNDLMLQITSVPTTVAADRIQTVLLSLERANEDRLQRLWGTALLLAALLTLSFTLLVFTLRSRFMKLDNDNRLLVQANQDVEEQLVQSAKLSALGQMVAGITHEINTPLAYVKAVFELIKERLLPEHENDVLGDLDEDLSEETRREMREELEMLLNDALHGLEEMATLVRTMKNFSRLDKGRIDSFSVEEGIESALLIARPQLKYVADVTREFDGVPTIVGSPSQLRQVILNLIVNAVDAMATLGRRGMLTIRTRLTSLDTVQIDVCDNGPGIPEDVLGRIFDPFFTTKPVGEGTGMGLSICYRIIENHGGTITVSSKPGRGTIFTITLPRQDEKSSAIPQQINPAAAA